MQDIERDKDGWPTAVNRAEGTFVCDRCKETIPINTDGITTGYGLTKDNKLNCYRCCGEVDKETMERSGKMDMYFTIDGEPGNGIPGRCHVSNWPGTVIFYGTYKKNKHNWHNVDRYDIWFSDDQGRPWYGVCISGNSGSQITRCRRLKHGNK